MQRSLTQCLIFAQQYRENIEQVGKLYTHVKSYHAAIHGYKKALFSTISSLALGYIASQFLFPEQLVQVVTKLAKEKIQLGTWLSPALNVGHEAYH